MKKNTEVEEHQLSVVTGTLVHLCNTGVVTSKLEEWLQQIRTSLLISVEELSCRSR